MAYVGRGSGGPGSGPVVDRADSARYRGTELVVTDPAVVHSRQSPGSGAFVPVPGASDHLAHDPVGSHVEYRPPAPVS